MEKTVGGVVVTRYIESVPKKNCTIIVGLTLDEVEFITWFWSVLIDKPGFRRVWSLVFSRFGWSIVNFFFNTDSIYIILLYIWKLEWQGGETQEVFCSIRKQISAPRNCIKIDLNIFSCVLDPDVLCSWYITYLPTFNKRSMGENPFANT